MRFARRGDWFFLEMYAVRGRNFVLNDPVQVVQMGFNPQLNLVTHEENMPLVTCFIPTGSVKSFLVDSLVHYWVTRGYEFLWGFERKDRNQYFELTKNRNSQFYGENSATPSIDSSLVVPKKINPSVLLELASQGALSIFDVQEVDRIIRDYRGKVNTEEPVATPKVFDRKVFELPSKAIDIW